MYVFSVNTSISQQKLSFLQQILQFSLKSTIVYLPFGLVMNPSLLELNLPVPKCSKPKNLFLYLIALSLSQLLPTRCAMPVEWNAPMTSFQLLKPGVTSAIITFLMIFNI